MGITEIFCLNYFVLGAVTGFNGGAIAVPQQFLTVGGLVCQEDAPSVHPDVILLEFAFEFLEQKERVLPFPQACHPPPSVHFGAAKAPLEKMVIPNSSKIDFINSLLFYK